MQQRPGLHLFVCLFSKLISFILHSTSPQPETTRAGYLLLEHPCQTGTGMNPSEKDFDIPNKEKDWEACDFPPTIPPGSMHSTAGTC